MSATKEANHIPAHPENFEPTRWSLVLRAAAVDSTRRRAALEDLCRAYWYPLYAFLRRSGRGREDAEDIAQEFFARLLDGRLLAGADPAKGKFRTLLLAALRKTDADAWRTSSALKRGGGAVAVPIDGDFAEKRFLADESEGGLPELAFDRAWAAALMERAWARLREKYTTPEKAAQFAEFAPRLSGGGGTGTLADAGARLGMSEPAARQAIARLRQKFGEVLRAEVAETVGSREAVQEEMRHLLSLFP
jgi:DNA-directed RNA polymerase specialized sigma24 family protein